MSTISAIALLFPIIVVAAYHSAPASTPPARAAVNHRIAPNTAVTFFRSAEIQCEDDLQRADLARALEDLLLQSPAQLARRRYPDYGGRPASWTNAELLGHYLLPVSPQSIDPLRFYHDAGTSAARREIRRKLAELRAPN